MDTLLPPPPPLQLTGNVSENWRKFRQKFEIYLQATGTVEKDDKRKTSVLLHVIGEEAVEVYNTFTWDVMRGDPPALVQDQNMKLNIVLQKFEDYCLPRKNLVYEMHKFISYKLKPGESIDQFVTELKTRAKTCELGPLERIPVISQVVCGISDNVVREKLEGKY